MEWASEGEHEEDEEASASAARLQVEATTHTHIQDARIAAVQHPRPLARASTLTQITNFSPIHHTRPADRAAVAVSEPSTLTGYQPSIDTVGNRTTVVESGSWKQQRYC